MANSPKKTPLVSVIIPTFNSEIYLDKCLKSIELQDYNSVDIIVIDDGSTDATTLIAKKHRCFVYVNPRSGRAEAKNEGIRVAQGKYVLFVDSDMELTQHLISECVERAESNTKIAGIIIPERSIGDSFWVRARDFERTFYVGTAVESARFFPTAVAREVGGFAEKLVFYEESTLPYKIQKKGYDVPERIESPMLHHEENFSLHKWLGKKFNYGRTLQTYSKAYCDYYEMQTNVKFRLNLFWKDGKRFRSRHQEASSVILLKSLEYVAISLGRICSMLS
jgi:glycosyltransferase involved in cell wall biosynthesis